MPFSKDTEGIDKDTEGIANLGYGRNRQYGFPLRNAGYGRNSYPGIRKECYTFRILTKRHEIK